MKEIVLLVNGMMCGNCEKHVNEAALSVAGVKSAVADKDAKNVVVKAKDSVDPNALKAAIEEAGYEVVGVEEKTVEEKKGFFSRFKK